MANERIRIELEADDDASQVIDRVADDADELERDPVVVEVDADTTRAEQGLAGVRSKADAAGDGMGDLTDKTSGAKNAMANLVGNSAQDLGALGGAAGGAGVAIGQLAEFAADGNVSLKSITTLAGPMVALGVATKVISDHFATVAKSKAFSADQVDGWVGAMREGKSLTQAIAENYEKAGKVEVQIGRDVADLTGVLAELGIGMEEFVQLQQMSEAELEAWSSEMAAAGANTRALGLAVLGAKSSADDLANAEELAAIKTRVFGDDADDAARKTANLSAAYERLSGLLSDESAYLSAADAIDGVEAAALEAAGAAVAFGAGSEEAQDANRALAQQLNAAKAEVLAYAEQVGNIPPEVATQINTLLNEGDIAGAEARLAALEQDRNVKLNVSRGAGWGDLSRWIPQAGATTNVTINAPRGTRPAELIAAGTAYARRNGRR